MKHFSYLLFVLILLLFSCGEKIVCKECGDGKNFKPKKFFRSFFKKDLTCDKIRKLFKPLKVKGRIRPLKPVIYLYAPQKDTISIKLHYKGNFTATYPEYKNGWKVIADSLGNLKDPDTQKKYYCLFWEGDNPFQPFLPDLSKGFVIRGDSTALFLETTLKKLGLNDREANEFIIFWLPKMKNNPYNFISFIGKEYEELAPLEITPIPTSILRVYMVYKPLNKKIEVSPQDFPTFRRKGFTVIEWGGSEIEQFKQ
jgi:hypothetical protein